MHLVEPSTVLLETGDDAVFSTADGPTAPIRGLLEDGIFERQTGETTRDAHEWQFTCSTREILPHDIPEGTPVTIGARSFEVLDTVVQDASFTTFLLDPL